MYVMSSTHVQNQIKDKTYSVGVPKLALERIRNIKMPICEIEIQKKFVDEINEELKIINKNQKLIDKFEILINNKINSVWSN